MKVTIAERIKLHGLGYTRQEIDEMANEPEETPAENPAPEQAVNTDNSELLGALNDIKTQLQQMAIQQSSNPGADPEQSVSDILNSLINNVKE